MANPSLASLCPSSSSSYFTSSNRILSFSESAHFTTVVSCLSSLCLSPSMATVNLALDNSVPDAFASLAALLFSYTPLVALLSTGTFVSAFVVGLIAIFSGPFPLEHDPFLHDVFFYLHHEHNVLHLLERGYLFVASDRVRWVLRLLLGWCLYGYEGRGGDGEKWKGEEEELRMRRQNLMFDLGSAINGI